MGCFFWVIMNDGMDRDWLFQPFQPAQHFHLIIILHQRCLQRRPQCSSTYSIINSLRKFLLLTHQTSKGQVTHLQRKHHKSPVEGKCAKFRIPIMLKYPLPCCAQFDWKRVYDRRAGRLWDMVKPCCHTAADF